MSQPPEMQGISQQAENLRLGHKALMPKEDTFLPGEWCCLPPTVPKQQLPSKSARADSNQLLDRAQEEVLFPASKETLSVQHLVVQSIFLRRRSFTRTRVHVNAHTLPNSLLVKEKRHRNHRSSPGCN